MSKRSNKQTYGNREIEGWTERRKTYEYDYRDDYKNEWEKDRNRRKEKRGRDWEGWNKEEEVWKG